MALLHQHRISLPDYLIFISNKLNEIATVFNRYILKKIIWNHNINIVYGNMSTFNTEATVFYFVDK